MERPHTRPGMPRPRITVLASGSGTNLQAVIDATASGALAADIAAVVSNRTDAMALERARRHGIEAITVPHIGGECRPDYDERLAAAVAATRPDWVVLAGWMRLLTMKFLSRFPDRVVNLHPARPGELPGTGAIERAWDEAVAGRRTHSGVMIHLVPDEGVDDGPVLATVDVPIDPTGSLDEFAAAMHAAEHELLVGTLVTLTSGPRPDDAQEIP